MSQHKLLALKNAALWELYKIYPEYKNKILLGRLNTTMAHSMYSGAFTPLNKDISKMYVFKAEVRELTRLERILYAPG